MFIGFSLSGAGFVALCTTGIAFGTALGDFGFYTGNGSKSFGTWLRVSVSARLARCAGFTRLAFATWAIFAVAMRFARFAGLGSARRATKFFFLEGLIGVDFADARIAKLTTSV